VTRRGWCSAGAVEADQVLDAVQEKALSLAATPDASIGRGGKEGRAPFEGRPDAAMPKCFGRRRAPGSAGSRRRAAVSRSSFQVATRSFRKRRGLHGSGRGVLVQALDGVGPVRGGVGAEASARVAGTSSARVRKAAASPSTVAWRSVPIVLDQVFGLVSRFRADARPEGRTARQVAEPPAVVTGRRRGARHLPAAQQDAQAMLALAASCHQSAPVHRSRVAVGAFHQQHHRLYGEGVGLARRWGRRGDRCRRPVFARHQQGARLGVEEGS